MSLWTLAKEGRHDELTLGMPFDEITERCGPPTDVALDPRGRVVVARYDDIELHSHEDRLVLVHGEFGIPPHPPAMRSDRLQIESGPFRWPVDLDVVRSDADEAGLAVVVGDRWGSTVWQLGSAELLIASDDEVAALSIVLRR